MSFALLRRRALRHVCVKLICCEDRMKAVGDDHDVFIVGDMMSRDRLPGVAQVAIQSGAYVGKTIKEEVEHDGPPAPRDEGQRRPHAGAEELREARRRGGRVHDRACAPARFPGGALATGSN